MSNLIKAAEDIRSLAKRFAPIFAVADALEKIGSIEQAERDAVIRKDAAYAEEEKAKAVLAAKHEQLKAVELDIEAAKQKAEEIVSKAHAKAEEIVALSHEKSDAIVKDAKSQKEIIEKAIDSHRVKFQDLTVLIEQKKAELDKINLELEKMKAKIAAFVG